MGKLNDKLNNLAYQMNNDIGNFVHAVSGQEAAMNQQYRQNKELAKNQYQWAVQDMKKAGLNPAMLFGGGGGHTATATTGIGGGQNTFSNVAGIVNSAANLANQFNKDYDRENNIKFNQIAKLIDILL